MKHVILDTETDIADLQGGRKVRERINVPNFVVGCYLELGRLREKYADWSTPGVKHWTWRERPLEMLRGWFEDNDTLIYGHNIAFDLAVFLKEYPELRDPIFAALAAGRIFDTMILARLREPCEKAFSLDACAKRWLHKEVEGKGTIQTSFTRDHELSREQLDYAKGDVWVTAELAILMARVGQGSCYTQRSPIPFQRKRILCASKGSVGAGIGPWHPIDRLYCKASLYTSLLTEPIPWRLDKELLAKMHAEAQDETETAAKALYESGFCRRDRDTKALVRTQEVGQYPPPRKWTLSGYHYHRLHKGEVQIQPGRWVLDQKAIRRRLQALAVEHDLGDVPTSVKTGQLSLTYDYWKQYKELFEGTGLESFLAYARQQKYISSFYKPLLTVRGENVHPKYWVPGAETLRWAASRPCIHQVPKKLRPLYRAPKGKVIVGADYSALELYTLDHVMACLGIVGPLHETLASGVDPHSYAASLLCGGRWEDYPKGTEERQRAKALNFGVPGGMGPRKIYQLGRQQYGLDWDFTEARGLYYHFKDTYTDVAQYLALFDCSPYEFKGRDQSREEFLTKLGFPVGAQWPCAWDVRQRLDGGRFFDVQLPTGAVIPARNYTQAANCGFQSIGAQVTTLAYVRACEAGFDVIAQIHDSLQIAERPERAQSTGKWLCATMAEALAEVCTKAPRQQLEFEVKDHLV